MNRILPRSSPPRLWVCCALLLALGLAVPTVGAGDTSTAPQSTASDDYRRLSLRAIGLDTPLGDLRPMPPGRWELPHEVDRLRFESAPGVEAYFEFERDERGQVNFGARLENVTLYARVPAGSRLKGTLVVPVTGDSPPVRVDIDVPPADSDPEVRRGYYRAMRDHYRGFLDAGIAGSAWFRHRIRVACRELGEAVPNEPLIPNRAWRRGRVTDLDRTYDLLTGGRALSENLQLDRVIESGAGDRTIEVGAIEGIVVRPMDWKPLLDGLEVDVHPLAPAIPHDQHVVFFNSFASLVEWIDESKNYGSVFTGLTDTSSENSHVVERYQAQLVVPLDELARRLGEQLVVSIAATGSDPYLRTGSDLALLFECKSPDAFFAAQKARMMLTRSTGARWEEGERRGVAYVGVTTPGRTISSYLARLGDVTVVTNSLAQLDQLIAVRQGEVQSLDKTPEYAFFTARYRRDGEQDALVIISDETIRRWCSPEWRIGASRRIRASAYLSEIQAKYAGEIVRGDVAEPRRIETIDDYTEVGALTLTRDGVVSERYGSLTFLTPIRELDVAKVTEKERDGYVQFRNSYERRWRVFDPIALELTTTAGHMKFDLAVYPLTLGTDYRQLMDLVAGAEFASDAGDRHHGTLVHALWSISPDSQLRDLGRSFLGSGPKMDPLGWLGDYIELYLDRDDAWVESLKLSRNGFPEEESFFTAPLVLAFDVKNSFLLSGFLATITNLIQVSSPGLVEWTQLEHDGQPYVKVSPSERAKKRDSDIANLAVFYAPTANKLIVTLREDVLKAALARQEAAEDSTNPAPQDLPEEWLGKNVAMRADRDFLGLLSRMFGDAYQRRLERRCFANLPILEEWKRLFPDRDPVEVHAELWNVQLVCPSGGQYVWNEAAQAMESTQLGRPDHTKPGDPLGALLRGFRSANLGLTFEHDGIRVRASLERTQP